MALTFILMSYDFLKEKESVIEKKLSPKDRNRMELVINKQLNSKYLFEFSLSKNQRSLVIASNKNSNIKFMAILKSIKSRVLGISPVEIWINGEVKNHWGAVKQFTFKKGNKIYPGHYKVTLFGRAQNGDVFKFQKRIFLSASTPSEFEKRLKVYFNKLRVMKKVSPNEKMEWLLTFKTLNVRVIDLFNETVDSIEWGKEIRKFEIEYAQVMGPMLRSLVLELKNLMDSDKAGDIEEEISYSSLFQVGKKLGIMVSDMVTQVESIGKMSQEKRDKLKTMFSQRSKDLLNFLNKSVNTLLLETGQGNLE